MLKKQGQKKPILPNPAKTNFDRHKIASDLTSLDLWKRNDLNYFLIRAASDGKTDEARALLAKGANVNAMNDSGLTPLMLACRYGHKDAVDLLLDSKADINSSDNYGWTALMWAAANQRIGIMTLLIEHGAFVGIGKGQEPVRMWDKILNQAEANRLIMRMKAFQDLFLEGNFRPFLSDFRQCVSQ
jgi:ankyrin repeat protein